MITLQFSAEYLGDSRNIGYALRSLGSAAIRWWTWGDVSHVDCVMPDGQWFGARLSGGAIPREPYQVSVAKRVSFTLPDEAAFYKFLMDHKGAKYDVLQILGFVIHEDFESNNEFVCSVFIAAALCAGDPALRSVFAELDRISPANLRHIMSAYAAARVATQDG